VSPMATVNKPTKDNSDPSGKKPRKPEASASPIEQFKDYLLGVRSEWDKISWPTWPQIWGQTIVVLLMVAIMTTGLFILDYGIHFTISSITPHRS
jgi:preprotein translocase SecE subunit